MGKQKEEGRGRNYNLKILLVLLVQFTVKGGTTCRDMRSTGWSPTRKQDITCPPTGVRIHCNEGNVMTDLYQWCLDNDTLNSNIAEANGFTVGPNQQYVDYDCRGRFQW